MVAKTNVCATQKKRKSVTDTMKTDAEKLVSAEARGLIKFEKILPMAGMPIGGVGVGPGTEGEKCEKAFCAYIKQPAVVDRLVSEGFERSGGGAPHPWHLVNGVGVVSPANKVICQSLTPEQHEKIDVNRLAAIARKNGEPPLTSGADTYGVDTRPCDICGYGDDAGTIIHCDKCNTPFHDGCAGAPPIAGDWFCSSCK